MDQGEHETMDEMSLRIETRRQEIRKARAMAKGKKLTYNNLAKQFGVSYTTILKDVQAIEDEEVAELSKSSKRLVAIFTSQFKKVIQDIDELLEDTTLQDTAKASLLKQKASLLSKQLDLAQRSGLIPVVTDRGADEESKDWWDQAYKNTMNRETGVVKPIDVQHDDLGKIMLSESGAPVFKPITEDEDDTNASGDQ